MKAFIVDDEFLQRTLVKKVIDWEKIGVEIVGEAENGEEALEKILKDQPDIVIMDINIPYLNGIEVSKKVKEVLPDTQIIILTAYGEFEYARQALQLGAVSFVLKPVNPEELTREILKCQERLESIWESQNSIKQMQERITQKQKEQFLLEQLSGIAQPETEEAVNAALEIVPGTKMAVLFLKFQKEAESEALAKEIEEMVQDYFPRYEMLEIKGDDVYILLGNAQMEYQISVLCAYLQEVMNQEQLFRGGASRVHNRSTELRDAYLEAYSAFRQESTQGKIRMYEPLNMKSFVTAASYDADKLLAKLRQREYREFMEMVVSCFQDMEQGYSISQAAYYVAMDILIRFSLYMTDMGIDFARQIETDQKILFRLQENGQIREISDILQQVLKTGLVLLEKHKVPATRKKVQDARAYIDRNYYRFDMSLNLVADEIGVNASYLSNIFKKEFQCSLSKYITSTRLKAAEKIMTENPGKTLMEVAEAVGYSDVYYFSKNFKSFYGITPSRYLEEKQ